MRFSVKTPVRKFCSSFNILELFFLSKTWFWFLNVEWTFVTLLICKKFILNQTFSMITFRNQNFVFKITKPERSARTVGFFSLYACLHSSARADQSTTAGLTAASERAPFSLIVSFLLGSLTVPCWFVQFSPERAPFSLIVSFRLGSLTVPCWFVQFSPERAPFSLVVSFRLGSLTVPCWFVQLPPRFESPTTTGDSGFSPRDEDRLADFDQFPKFASAWSVGRREFPLWKECWPAVNVLGDTSLRQVSKWEPWLTEWGCLTASWSCHGAEGFSV